MVIKSIQNRSVFGYLVNGELVDCIKLCGDGENSGGDMDELLQDSPHGDLSEGDLCDVVDEIFEDDGDLAGCSENMEIDELGPLGGFGSAGGSHDGASNALPTDRKGKRGRPSKNDQMLQAYADEQEEPVRRQKLPMAEVRAAKKAKAAMAKEASPLGWPRQRRPAESTARKT